ncbi:MAG: Ig-like domain-containing protein [Paludibacteraceae bacterium]
MKTSVKFLSLMLALTTVLCVVSCKEKKDEVNLEATAIVLDVKQIQLSVGDTYQLTATLQPENSTSVVTWESLDEEIATIDANGLVTALAEGATKIYAETDNGKKVSCRVEVIPVINSLKLNLDTLRIKVNDNESSYLSSKLSVTVDPERAAEYVQWTFSPEGVVSRNAEGKLVALHPDTTVCIASIGATADSCVVIVIDESTKYPLYVGNALQITHFISDDVFNDGGSVRYDNNTNTLYLNNADAGKISQQDTEAETLTLEITGENQIYDFQCNDISLSELIVKGQGTLQVESTFNALATKLTIEDITFIVPNVTAVHNDGMILKNVTMKSLNEKQCGIWTSKLTLINSELDFSSKKCAIYGMSQPTIVAANAIFKEGDTPETAKEVEELSFVSDTSALIKEVRSKPYVYINNK